MKRVLIFALLLAPAALAAQTRMLRSPSVSGNQIVFAAAHSRRLAR